MVIPAPPQRFSIPDLPSADELLPFLRQIDENRWYSNFGPLTNSFESQFAQAMAKAHGAIEARRSCVAMSSGYHALSVGLRLMGVGPGKKVLTPAVTFPASPLVIENLGAEPLLADVDPENWVLTPAIARAAAERMKIDAVMPVAIYGMPLDATAWDSFTRETGIPVILDSAAAVETQHYTDRIYVAHSLHALKPFGVGEGGILVTPDADIARTARRIINFGMDNRITYMPGENAKMSEYHAAVALAQLKRWADIKMRRRRIFEDYALALSALEPEAVLHPGFEKTIASCLMVTIKSGDVPALAERLQNGGLAVHRTYLPPLYTHPHFKNLTLVNARGEALPPSAVLDGAESMSETILGLPFHAFLSAEEIHQNVKIFAQHLEEPMERRHAIA